MPFFLSPSPFMRCTLLSAGIIGLLCVLWRPLQAQERASHQFTLDEALERAFARSPALRARLAEVDEVRSGLVFARTYPYNPEVSLKAADRDGLEGSSSRDSGLALSQEFEIAGQRRKRIQTATAALAAAEERRRSELGRHRTALRSHDMQNT